MPRKCCVKTCNFNPHASKFSLPNDPERRARWVDNIRQANGATWTPPARAVEILRRTLIHPFYDGGDLFLRQLNSPFIPRRDGIYPFLHGGTLLVWCRECDFIANTSDADLAAFVSQLSPSVLCQLKTTIPCRLVRSFGFNISTHNDLYEIKLQCRGTPIDVFAMYNDSDISWVGMYGYRRFLLPLVKDLCMADLLGASASGVQMGKYAEEILRQWKQCTKYYLVDPWKQQTNYKDRANLDDEEQEVLYWETKNRFSLWQNKTEYYRMAWTSESVHSQFNHNLLDFVYIDARHDYCAVKEDIEMYWPKVRRGGILAGHETTTDARKKEVRPFVKMLRGAELHRNMSSENVLLDSSVITC